MQGWKDAENEVFQLLLSPNAFLILDKVECKSHILSVWNSENGHHTFSGSCMTSDLVDKPALERILLLLAVDVFGRKSV